MTLPRKNQIDLNITSYYHCISRCVRQSFLCGYDCDSNTSFDHRKHWIVDRIKLQSDSFCIGVCAYSVMSNHYHLVLKVDRDLAESLSDDEVIARWTKLFPSIKIVEQLQKDRLDPNRVEEAKKIIEKWRNRLISISWYMKSINQTISRQANKEDGCKGCFWQGRFTSQALLDDMAVLGCMAYVDLNPIRAGVADNLIESDYTSIYERICSLKEAIDSEDFIEEEKVSVEKQDVLRELFSKAHLAENRSKLEKLQPKFLVPFGAGAKSGVLQSLVSYLELVEHTGRIARGDKKGFISSSQLHVLDVLKIEPKVWLSLTHGFEYKFAVFIGKKESLYQCAQRFGKRTCKGIRALDNICY